MLTPWKESCDQLRQHIKKQRLYCSSNVKGQSSKSYGFSSSRIWMWEWDYKESWALKYWLFWTVVLEKTLDNPLWRSNQNILNEISPRCSLEGLMLKLNSNTLATLWEELIQRRPWCWKDWRREEKEMTEVEMASPTQWTWVWVNSQCWWWSGKPGVLQSTGHKDVDMAELPAWLPFTSISS